MNPTKTNDDRLNLQFVFKYIFVIGSDHLLQLLYETKAVDETQDINNLQDIPAIWRYKARISVDHLMQTLNISNQQCPVMRLFLKEVQ